MPAVRSPYLVNVRDVSRRPGELRELELDIVAPEAIGTPMIELPAGSEVQVDVRLESLHEGVLVTGEVEGLALGECSRCLTEVQQPLRVEFQELFAYSEDEAFDHTVHDDHVDLEPMVRDAVVLSLPFQPVCQADCPGLCPQCGVRLLDEPGHEHEAPADPRWAALAGLQLPDEAPADHTDSPDHPDFPDQPEKR